MERLHLEPVILTLPEDLGVITGLSIRKTPMREWEIFEKLKEKVKNNLLWLAHQFHFGNDACHPSCAVCGLHRRLPSPFPGPHHRVGLPCASFRERW